MQEELLYADERCPRCNVPINICICPLPEYRSGRPKRRLRKRLQLRVRKIRTRLRRFRGTQDMSE